MDATRSTRASRDHCAKLKGSLLDGPYCDANLDSLMSGWRSRVATNETSTPRDDDPEIWESFGDMDMLRQLWNNPYDAYHELVVELLDRLHDGEHGTAATLTWTAQYLERINQDAMRAGKLQPWHPIKTSPRWTGPVATLLQLGLPFAFDYSGGGQQSFSYRALAYGMRFGSAGVMKAELPGGAKRLRWSKGDLQYRPFAGAGIAWIPTSPRWLNGIRLTEWRPIDNGSLVREFRGQAVVSVAGDILRIGMDGIGGGRSAALTFGVGNLNAWLPDIVCGVLPICRLKSP
jgi:hypothetical protein